MAYSSEYIGKHPGKLLENRVLKAKGLKLKEVAESLDVSIGYLDDFIKGNRNLWSRLALNIETEYNILAKDLEELQAKYDEKVRQE